MALEDEKLVSDEDVKNEEQVVTETPTEEANATEELLTDKEESVAESAVEENPTELEEPMLDTEDPIVAEEPQTETPHESRESEPPSQVQEVAPTNSAEPSNSKSSGGGVLIKKSYLAIAAIAVMALVVGAIFFGMWLQNDKTDPWEIDPNAKDYESENGSIGNGSSDSIAIPGYADVVWKANTKNVQMVLLNPQGNPCYFRFTLILKESGEVLYTSGLVPPGQAVTDLRLSRALEKGNYNLLISIETFSLNDRSAMNGANVETGLTVR